MTWGRWTVALMKNIWTHAVLQTANYTSSAYWFGQNLVCSRQYVKTYEIYSILEIPWYPTDLGKCISL